MPSRSEESEPLEEIRKKVNRKLELAREAREKKAKADKVKEKKLATRASTARSPSVSKTDGQKKCKAPTPSESESDFEKEVDDEEQSEEQSGTRLSEDELEEEDLMEVSPPRAKEPCSSQPSKRRRVPIQSTPANKAEEKTVFRRDRYDCLEEK